MNPKHQITHKVLEILSLSPTEKEYQTALNTWWANTRTKSGGGLRLTDLGYETFNTAGIKSYLISYEKSPIFFTNKLIIWLDHFVDCPYYLTPYEIYVFSEKMAVQLMLFSGNIYKYGQAKQLSKNS
jgi:hypothetical protein